MEMTRQRAAESLASTHLFPARIVTAKGVIKSPMTMSVELQRALHSVMRKYQDNVHEVKVDRSPRPAQSAPRPRMKSTSSISSAATPDDSRSAPIRPITTRSSSSINALSGEELKP